MQEPVNPLYLLATAGFYVVGAATLFGALVTVMARNLFRAALGLALTLFGIAAIYFYLRAEFLAVAQLLVYVGAILTLLIFGVMLTQRIADPNIQRWNRQVAPVAVLAALIGGGLGWYFLRAPWVDMAPGALNTATLGHLLISNYLAPFELLSVLLLGALVGSVVIARKN